MMLNRKAAVLSASLLLGGCASVPQQAGFPEVEQAVAQRTQGLRMHWNRGTASDAAVAESIRSIVRSELTADQAVQLALLNNPALQATYEDLMVAQADLVQSGLLRNPVFDAEVKLFGDGTNLEVAVVQEFLDVFFIPMRRRLAGAEFEAAKARVAGEVIGLAAQVRAGYYRLVTAQQTLELRQQVLIATEASFDLARRLREAGNITDLDLANERSLYEQSKVDLAAAEALTLRLRESLNELMGTWGQMTSWTVPDRLPPLDERPMVFEEVQSEAIKNNLQLAATRQQIEASALRLGIARPMGLIEEIEVGVAAEREPDGEWGIGPGFSIPIPLWTQGQPAIARAQAELRRSMQQYAATAIQTRSRVRTAWADLHAARSRAEYYQAVLLPLNERIVNESQLQYNAMQIGAFQLLQAKRQQIQTAEQYIQTLQDYWLARTELEQIAAGQLGRVDRESPGVMGAQRERLNDH
jgi:outer membrane protein, heavy metal efflux system